MHRFLGSLLDGEVARWQAVKFAKISNEVTKKFENIFGKLIFSKFVLFHKINLECGRPIAITIAYKYFFEDD